MLPKIGDRITAQGFPLDYPLVILAAVSGRYGIGSELWPQGASRPVELHEITSWNGKPVSYAEPGGKAKWQSPAQPKRLRTRKAA
jgi:hypothetical protein